MENQKKGKIIAVVGYVILVVSILGGGLISFSPSDSSQPSVDNQWAAVESALKLIAPVIGAILVGIGMKLQRKK